MIRRSGHLYGHMERCLSLGYIDEVLDTSSGLNRVGAMHFSSISSNMWSVSMYGGLGERVRFFGQPP
jgi:hypothetical protein